VYWRVVGVRPDGELTLGRRHDVQDEAVWAILAGVYGGGRGQRVSEAPSVTPKGLAKMRPKEILKDWCRVGLRHYRKLVAFSECAHANDVEDKPVIPLIELLDRLCRYERSKQRP